MNDFHGRLECQLVDAGRRRAQRGRWRLALAGRGRPLLAAATVLLALAAVVVFAPGLRSGSPVEPGGGAAPPAPPAGPPPPAVAPPSADRTPAPALRGISVAVLNGTTTAGAARAVADRLEQRGARLEAVGNAADQARVQTAVAYRPGQASQARLVARVLGVQAVYPRAGMDRALARVDVVVHVGSESRGR